jgi:N-methylhydantoinase B
MSMVDPVTYEVLRHRLWSINEEHGLTIARISGSPIVTFSHDFNPCVHLPDGEVVFSGPYIQYLNAGASGAIAWLLDAYGPDFVRPGDMFLTNDPWIGVSHQLDVCILAPVHADGELLGWVSNAVHQYDLGGMLPGSFTPQAETIYEEATPMPPFRIVEEGTIRPDLERLFLRRSRLPDLLALDLRAGIGGCNVAAQAMLEAVAEYGAATVREAMRRVVEESETAFVERLAEIPAGRWTQEYFVESRDPAGGLVRLVLGLEKFGDELVFDNRGDADQDVAQAMTRVGFEGAVLAAVAAALCNDQMFAIGGATRRVRFELTPRTLGNAEPPAPMSCANMRVAQLTSIASHVVAKMLSCSPSRAGTAVGAGASSGMPVLLVSGRDADGNPFGTALSDHMAGGVAPSPTRDGVDSGGHSWDPRSLVPNVEDQELVFPILYLYRNELPDSGGAGARRGANGGSFAYVPLAVPELTIATVTAGAATRMPPCPGLAGGHPSGTSAYRLLRDAGPALGDGSPLPRRAGDLGDGWEHVSARSSGVRQGARDIVEERWCGSGGLGDPLDREPERVRRDVLDERISAARARELHGVALAGDEVDAEETARVREQIRARRRAASSEPSRTPPPAAGEREVAAVGVHLRILRSAAGDVWTCSCGAPLVGADADYRDGCRRIEHDLDAGELGPYGSAEAGDRLIVREHLCPSCLRLLSTDVGLPDAPPERDVELVLA